jgi:hypothetical protein
LKDDAMKSNSTLKQIKTHDNSRPGISGEHWLALGLGLAAWLLTRKSTSFAVRTAGMMAGTALVGRAASGRDGLAKVLRYLPVGGRISLGR